MPAHFCRSRCFYVSILAANMSNLVDLRLDSQKKPEQFEGCVLASQFMPRGCCPSALL
jgi:hypothetical protein